MVSGGQPLCRAHSGQAARAVAALLDLAAAVGVVDGVFKSRCPHLARAAPRGSGRSLDAKVPVARKRHWRRQGPVGPWLVEHDEIVARALHILVKPGIFMVWIIVAERYFLEGTAHDLSAFPSPANGPPSTRTHPARFRCPRPMAEGLIMLVETGLPYEPTWCALTATTRCRRSFCRSTRTTRSPPSSTPKAGRPAAGAVRVGRHPGLPGRQSGTLHCWGPAARYRTL